MAKNKEKTKVIQIVALVWGVLALIPALIGLIPCFTTVIWLTLWFMTLGLFLTGGALFYAKKQGEPAKKAGWGLALCITALILSWGKIIFSFIFGWFTMFIGILPGVL